MIGSSKNRVGVFGFSTNSVGVFGQTRNPASYAGSFDGNVLVVGSFTAFGTKVDRNSNIEVVPKMKFTAGVAQPLVDLTIN